MSFEEQLRYLEHLIINLPTLPIVNGPESIYGSFLNFTLDEAYLAKCEDEVGTLSCQFKDIFGWKSRTSGDGIVPITERGDALRAVVDVLRHWSAKYPGNAVIEKWAEDICLGVKKVYTIHNVPIPDLNSVSSINDSGTGNEGSSKPPGKRKRKPSIEIISSDSEDEDDEGSSGKAGRKRDPLLEKCVVRLKRYKGRDKPHWQCVACSHTRSGFPSKNRVFPHTTTCKKIKADYPNVLAAVVRSQAGNSLGARRERETGSSAPAEPQPPQKKTKVVDVETLAKETGRLKLQDDADHAIMLLVCKCGLAPSILDTAEWKRVVNILNPHYHPTSSSTFTEKLIPQEAEYVRTKQVDILKASSNLTISFDGGSTRKDAIYFVHATTPERDSYFIAGCEGTDEKHTATWIAEQLTEVIKPIAHLCNAFVSDRATNASGARDIVTTRNSAALNLGDCCHHLHNTTKDITELSEFKWMSRRLKAIIAHMSKSTYSRIKLRQYGEETGEKVRALQKIGKTRFGSHNPAAMSVLAVLGHIRTLFQDGVIAFKNKRLREMFSRGGWAVYTRFENTLRQYGDFTTPLTRSIWALEASQATLSDVFAFFLAIAAAFEEVLKDEGAGISTDLGNSVIEIFNDRYDEIFNENHDEYFTAFALDPRYPLSDVMLVAPTMNPSVVLPRSGADLSVRHPRAYDRVRTYIREFMLSKMLPHYAKVLAEHGEDEAIRLYGPIHELGETYKERENASGWAIQRQLLRFWNNEYPFNEPVENNDVYGWWKDLLTNPKANILAFFAVRLFSILPNSMPDERTGSRFTWLNSALRGNQKAQTLIDMVQISQFYERATSKKSKARKEKCRPTVKFRDVKQDILDRVKSSSRAVRNGGKDEEESDGDELDNEEPADNDDQAMLLAAATHSSGKPSQTLLPTATGLGVNLRSYVLRDLLSDKPLVPVGVSRPSRTVDCDAVAPAGSEKGGWDW